MRSWKHWLVSSALAVTSLGAVSIRASAQDVEEPWYFTGDIGVAGPIGNPADQFFGIGGDGSLGVYRSVIPEISLGGRLGVGILSEDNELLGDGSLALRRPVDVPAPPPAPPVTPPPAVPPPVVPPAEPPQVVEDHGILDYEYITANLRVRPLARLFDEDRRGTGLYLDIGAGVGLMEGDFAPAFNAAIGWNFGLGPVAIGPKFRFTHMMQNDETDHFGGEDIFTWMAGVEVAFLDEVEVIPPPRVTAELPPGAELEAEAELRAEDTDPDGDWIVGANDLCPNEREVFNGFEDTDGCPDEGVGQMENDALVVDERVFFDYDSSELRETGTEQLDEIVEHYRQYGDRYEALIISGHTDSRGTIPYNEGLSRERADAVVEYLVAQGVPRDVIEVEARGELLPAIPDAQTEFEHQVNRRVAFRVQWQEGRRPEGIAPIAEPTMPDYVDEAPARVQEREMRADVREREARERELAQQEMDALDEGDRVALAREREGTERLEQQALAETMEVEAGELALEGGEYQAEAGELEMEAGELQAEADIEAQAELEQEERQARID